METVNFDNLVGEQAKLYACNDLNRFQLGSVIFEVMEDESDGYRSLMQDVKIVSTNNPTNVFLDDVVIFSSEIGYTINSQTQNHRWLEFGTDNGDDYYPSFVFNFTPMLPVEERIKTLITL